MKSFENEKLNNFLVSHNLLNTIREIGEFKGKQDLYKQQSPQILESLKKVAIIQSVESSNRIEGITASHKKIEEIVANKTVPINRSEQEIAGYRDALNLIHANYEGMDLNSGLILYLHEKLYQYIPCQGGRWKSSDNEIREKRADGTTIVRFTPIKAFLVNDMMESLNFTFNRFLSEGKIDPLLLIPAYILDFLCIHPFGDGNGRMARLLSLLLLYKAGYEVGRYVSFEKKVEETSESYYESLRLSSQNWHEGEHDLLPWFEYFLGVMLYSSYRDFEQRTDVFMESRGSKSERVRKLIESRTGQFTISDIEKLATNVSRATVRRVLNNLRNEKRVNCLGRGRDALWEKI